MTETAGLDIVARVSNQGMRNSSANCLELTMGVGGSANHLRLRSRSLLPWPLLGLQLSMHLDSSLCLLANDIVFDLMLREGTFRPEGFLTISEEGRHVESE